MAKTRKIKTTNKTDQPDNSSVKQSTQTTDTAMVPAVADAVNATTLAADSIDHGLASKNTIQPKDTAPYLLEYTP